ncbi:MAG: hypothetical protein AAF961_17875, partial [Planctomycetota bacterium]
WMDRVLPSPMRPGICLSGLNLTAGCGFLFLGVKGYWDFGGWPALGILAATIGVGYATAVLLRPFLATEVDEGAA